MSTTSSPGRTGDPLITVLDLADALPDAAELRSRSYELLNAPPERTASSGTTSPGNTDTPGRIFSDVGCGTGLAVAELSARGVHAIGVDVSEQMITEARRRAPTADLRAGAAYRLPFADGELAGYRADKVYHALDDPARALREAGRVLAPGGRIVLTGHDWDALVIDSDDPELTRAMTHARADTLPSPRAARRYRNLLLDAGFTAVSVEVHTSVLTGRVVMPMLTGIAEGAHAAGAVSREQADAWLTEQAGRDQAGRTLLAVPIFVAAAGQP